MTITLELPPTMAARLEETAQVDNISQDLLASQLLALSLPPTEFKNGAEMVEYWTQTGLIGMWADREDMKDSTAWVQQQREKTSERAREKMQGITI